MGGKAFGNVIPVPKESAEKIVAWMLTLFRHGNLPYCQHQLDKLYDFYLGSSNFRCRAIGDKFKNLHEFLVEQGLRTLGSTMKKQLSGDIDIAVSDSLYTYGDLTNFLTERLGTDNVKTNQSLNQIYTRIHVPGSGWHQVDFMLGDVELLEFTHWSPDPGTSHYSGSHRTELIKAVAKALSSWTWVLPDDHPTNPGEMIGRVGYTLNHDKGLVHGARYAPARLDGKGYTKKMVPVTEQNYDDFLNQYERYLQNCSTSHIDNCSDILKFRDNPSIIITKTSTDPNFIAQQVFGNGITPTQLNSYEAVVDVILANPELRKIKGLIWGLFVERLVQIGQPIPSNDLNGLHSPS